MQKNSKELFNKLQIIATENVIMIIHNSKRVQFTKENSQFNVIKEMIRNRDEEGIINAISKGSYIIADYSNGLFKVDEKQEVVLDIETNTTVDLVLSHRIIDWAKNGFPFEPLLKFHRNVIKNPNKESAMDLYAFLENNLIPITNKGTFIAYKKVTTVDDRLMDSHSKTVCNNVGSIVSMPREKVNPDRTETCSYGYHVGAWDYVSSFSGDTIIEVEVNPEDVVSVPVDYNRQKMRVCKYKVIKISGGDIIKDKLVKVNKKEKTINKVNPTFENMTAQQIKNKIKADYGQTITIDNKNKKSIIKKALQIMNA